MIESFVFSGPGIVLGAMLVILVCALISNWIDKMDNIGSIDIDKIPDRPEFNRGNKVDLCGRHMIVISSRLVTDGEAFMYQYDLIDNMGEIIKDIPEFALRNMRTV